MCMPHNVQLCIQLCMPQSQNWDELNFFLSMFSFNVTTILNSYAAQNSFCKYDEFSYCLGKLEHVSMS